MVHCLGEMDRDAGILSRYWITYYLVYFGVAIGLALAHRDKLTSTDGLHTGASIVAVSAGIAVAAAVLVEIGGSLFMLLIPATFRHIQQKALRRRDEAIRAWVEANPDLKKMIASGKIPPPPNGSDGSK